MYHNEFVVRSPSFKCARLYPVWQGPRPHWDCLVRPILPHLLFLLNFAVPTAAARSFEGTSKCAPNTIAFCKYINASFHSAGTGGWAVRLDPQQPAGAKMCPQTFLLTGTSIGSRSGVLSCENAAAAADGPGTPIADEELQAGALPRGIRSVHRQKTRAAAVG